MEVRATAYHESWCYFENPLLASIPVEIWQSVFGYLAAIDHESLYLTCRTFRILLKGYPLMGPVGHAALFGTFTLLSTSNKYLYSEDSKNKVRWIGNEDIFEKWIQNSEISVEAIKHKEAIGNRLLILLDTGLLIILKGENESEYVLDFQTEVGEFHGINRIVEQNNCLYIEFYYSFGWHHHDGWNEEDGYEDIRKFLIVLDSTTGAFLFNKNLIRYGELGCKRSHFVNIAKKFSSFYRIRCKK